MHLPSTIVNSSDGSKPRLLAAQDLDIYEGTIVDVRDAAGHSICVKPQRKKLAYGMQTLRYPSEQIVRSLLESHDT